MKHLFWILPIERLGPPAGATGRLAAGLLARAAPWLAARLAAAALDSICFLRMCSARSLSRHAYEGNDHTEIEYSHTTEITSPENGGIQARVFAFLLSDRDRSSRSIRRKASGCYRDRPRCFHIDSQRNRPRHHRPPSPVASSVSPLSCL